MEYLEGQWTVEFTGCVFCCCHKSHTSIVSTPCLPVVTSHLIVAFNQREKRRRSMDLFKKNEWHWKVTTYTTVFSFEIHQFYFEGWQLWIFVNLTTGAHGKCAMELTMRKNSLSVHQHVPKPKCPHILWYKTDIYMLDCNLSHYNHV